MPKAGVAFNAVLIAAGLLLSAFLWLSASGNSPGFLPLGSPTARPAEVTLARALPQRQRAGAPKRARSRRTNAACARSRDSCQQRRVRVRDRSGAAGRAPPDAGESSDDAGPRDTTSRRDAAASSSPASSATGDRDRKPRRGCADVDDGLWREGAFDAPSDASAAPAGELPAAPHAEAVAAASACACERSTFGGHARRTASTSAG